MNKLFYEIEKKVGNLSSGESVSFSLKKLGITKGEFRKEYDKFLHKYGHSHHDFIYDLDDDVVEIEYSPEDNRDEDEFED